VIEERGDEGGQLDVVLLDGHRSGLRDFLFLFQQVLQTTQHHRLAAADHTPQGDQPAFEDGAADVSCLLYT
ncbi:hypothetical protein, partial [Pseudomonas aeruginosa]|uniref:hypothetical protein n=1 Tax=Pseudomonas aeruginosa TaxID=287 RepID=UPI0024BC801E